MEEAGHLGADRFRLGQLSCRGEQGEPAVVGDRLRLDLGGLAEAALELEQRPARGEPGVGLELRDLDAVDIAELGEEAAPRRRQHLAVLPGKGDRHLGAAPELADQLQLLNGEVVEAVEENGPSTPGLGPGAQRGGGRGCQRVIVVAAELVADLQTGLVERRDLELIRTRLGGPLAKGERIDRGRLKLGDQLVEGGGEAGASGGGGEQPKLRPGDRLSGKAPPLGDAQRRTRRGVGRSRDQGEEPVEGDDRGADHGLAPRGQLALEALDVVHRGHDEHRVAASGSPEALQDRAGAAGVGWPRDQRKCHRIQHRQDRGAGKRRGCAHNARKLRARFCRRGAVLSLPLVTPRESPKELRATCHFAS